jgi:hypothetical protein
MGPWSVEFCFGFVVVNLSVVETTDVLSMRAHMREEVENHVQEGKVGVGVGVVGS